MTDESSGESAAFDPGSFRDPLSRVVIRDGVVQRVVRGRGVDDLEALRASSLFTDAQADGRLVGTRSIPVPAELAASGWEAALEHDRIPVISYPYEWTFSMLQDAAQQQLGLARAALAEGLLTKDATPYNTQFVGASPTFIDIGSFEQTPSGEPWRGYRQFCMLFYLPLLLQASIDVAFQPLLRGSIHGVTPATARRMLPLRHRVGKGAFTNVVLHARLEERNADSDRNAGKELSRAGYGPKLIDAQLAKLEKNVAVLTWSAGDSEWSSYSDRGHYQADELSEKADFVERVARAGSREVVVDLGANDGHFSRLVAPFASTVVAVDSDALVIDRLYRTLRRDGDRTILPLYSDLTDPSPSLGWRNRERPTLTDRLDADLVLALALVHHLAISGTVPLPDVVAMLRDFDAEVVVEFPDRGDPMVERLLDRKRDGLLDHYTLDAFADAITARFEVVERTALRSGHRHLFHLRPR
jgi:hypothetical protein